jgi:outer membrane lipoprotein-sorting protein
MKKIVLTILVSMICGNISSQGKLNESEKTAFEQKMAEQSKKIRTLQCCFVQEKTSTVVAAKAVAKGILLYQSPSMLRWEYTEPSPSSLILNGKNACFLDKNGEKQGNTNMLKQIGSLIISMINGEGLRQSKQFATEVFDSEKEYTVILTPDQRRLKDLYKSIELKINKETLLALEIVMNEKSGDKTSIVLNDIILNSEIDTNKFAVK